MLRKDGVRLENLPDPVKASKNLLARKQEPSKPNGPYFKEFILDKRWPVSVKKNFSILLEVMGFGLFHLERRGMPRGSGSCGRLIRRHN
jgi:hypothetical protein